MEKVFFRLDQCVFVRRRCDGRLGCNHGAGARPVVDHDRLAGGLHQTIALQSGDNVERRTGREWNDDPYRFRRIGHLSHRGDRRPVARARPSAEFTRRLDECLIDFFCLD